MKVTLKLIVRCYREAVALALQYKELLIFFGGGIVVGNRSICVGGGCIVVESF